MKLKKNTKKRIIFIVACVLALLAFAIFAFGLSTTTVGDLTVTGTASGITAAMIGTPPADCAGGQ